MPDLSDDELLEALGGRIEEPKRAALTPLQERVLVGFEDIVRFATEHGRPPSHGGADIFERLYAVRLDRIRRMGEHHDLLRPLDATGLLEGSDKAHDVEALSDDALLDALGGSDETSNAVTNLRHVRSSHEKRAAEEIAKRDPCPDFEAFKPLFRVVQDDLDAGRRRTLPFERKSEIEQGRFFVLEGQKVYVADVSDVFRQDYGDNDARLRVVYDNGTQSNLLMRSLQRALTKDENGRRITEPNAGPLFGSEGSDSDTQSGTIYVLRSLSDLDIVARNHDLLHKVGVTGGSVERRIANASKDPTYLRAEVEVVATYELLNIDRTKLEHLLHRTLEPARLDVEIVDRFGDTIHPREWYLVPLTVIDEVVERMREGTITALRYDPQSAALVEA